MYTHKLVKIIAEKRNSHWSAWLEHDPQTAFTAEWPALAIRNLFNHFGRSRFVFESIMPIEEARTNCHIEFMIAMRGMRPIPTPSVN